MYLLEHSSEDPEQWSVFGIDCPSDGWQNQMKEIHMICPVCIVNTYYTTSDQQLACRQFRQLHSEVSQKAILCGSQVMLLR